MLRRLVGKYGFMLRFVFQPLLESCVNVDALERHRSSDTELLLRYAKDAVQEAQALIRARHEAMQDGLILWTQRVKKTQERSVRLKNIAPTQCPAHCRASTETIPATTPASVLSTACGRADVSAGDLWHPQTVVGPIQNAR